MITDYTDNDYPTLPFKVRASGYSTTNSNDFTFTEFNGAPGRSRASFLNGWKTAQIQILLKNEYEQFAWQTFYDMDYSGTTGGIQSGVMPCFIECELGGQFGKFLCLITNPEFKKTSYQGKTAVLTLAVQVRPEIIGDDAECKKEVFEAFISCGVTANQFTPYLQGFKKLAEIDMNPINYYSRLVFKLNGVNQYITMPQVDLVTGDTVSFKFIANDNSYTQVFLCRQGDSNLALSINGMLRVTFGSGTLDGNPIINDVTPMPDDGEIHEIVCTLSQSTPLRVIGSTESPSANFSKNPIFDLDIKAASGNRFYPIDKVGWAMQNQRIVNSIDQSGLTDGESVNFDEIGWVEIEIK